MIKRKHCQNGGNPYRIKFVTVWAEINYCIRSLKQFFFKNELETKESLEICGKLRKEVEKFG